MLTVTRRFHFEAAHFLPFVPDGHKCKRMHGHNYELEVTISGSMIEPQGWILDFFDLDRFVMMVVGKIDHQLLNDFVDNPTVEVLAPWVKQAINDKILANSRLDCRCTKLRLYETKDCWADVCD